MPIDSLRVFLYAASCSACFVTLSSVRLLSSSSFFRCVAACVAVYFSKLEVACKEGAATEKLTVSQAAAFLHQTHARNRHEFKEIAVSFVRRNFAEISQTDGMEEIDRELLLKIVKGRNLGRPYRTHIERDI
jgi:hypothetical protein